MPRSLGIEPHSYGRDQFYADVQAYIRFKTPAISLAALVDEGDERSPLQRVKRLVGTEGEEPPRDDTTHEMQMLGCLVRAHVRDIVADLRERVDHLNGDAAEREVLAQDIRAATERLLRDTERVLKAFRGLRPDFIRTRMPAWSRELFEYTDEYLSLFVEGHLTALLSKIDSDEPLRQAVGSQRGKLAAAVSAEQEHRRAAGYESVIGDGKGRATFVHRKGALKKFMSSVLFLDISKEKEGGRTAHILAGIAAGIAMLFSTVLAIWSQEVYGINSFPFVIALVITYVFKDRIKEWLRTYLSVRAHRLLSDFNVTIRDPVNDIVVGQCRETFSYVDAQRIAPAVFKCRHADAKSVLEPDSKPETIIRYTKHVTIQGQRIARVHGRLLDINDIIRLNVSQFLVRMDDPIREVETYDRARDAVRRIALPKTYHINVVLVLRAHGRAASTERFRIVLDKHGIRDLQEVT